MKTFPIAALACALLITACSSDEAFYRARHRVLNTPVVARLRAADWDKWVDARTDQVVEVTGKVQWFSTKTGDFHLTPDLRCWTIAGQNLSERQVRTGSLVTVKGVVGGRGEWPGQDGMDLYACRILKITNAR